jgi:hypothetical protein
MFVVEGALGAMPMTRSVLPVVLLLMTASTALAQLPAGPGQMPGTLPPAPSMAPPPTLVAPPPVPSAVTPIPTPTYGVPRGMTRPIIGGGSDVLHYRKPVKRHKFRRKHRHTS